MAYKPRIRDWLRSRKKTDPELPYEPPIWMGNYSNGEYFHTATKKERLMREMILKEGAERAKRYGMDRREFMASGLGMTLTMSVINLMNGCSSDGTGSMGGMNPGAGASAPTPMGNATNPVMGMPPQAMMGGQPPPQSTTGGPSNNMMGMPPTTGPDQPSTMPPGMMNPEPGMMTTDPMGMGMEPPATTPEMIPMDMPDPVECEVALDMSDKFIFDIQTHRVETAPGIYSGFLGILPQARCGKGVPGCYSKDEYIRQMFIESDTTMTVLSGIPAVDGANPLTNEQIAETRDYVNGLASDSQRIITHAMVLPNYNHEMQLEGMARLAQEVAPIGSWKCYTPWGPGNGVTGYWLDDPNTGLPMIMKGREVGVKVFCCHKGLPLPGFDNNYGDPKDIGVVAKMFPDTKFVVYHSAYQYGSSDETTPYTDGARTGVNSLVTACRENGIEPGGNVYAELGSTWYRIMRNSTAATHVLGKLLKYIGEDNVVWGTDCMWYGSPQPQIQAFMSFNMNQQVRDREGYPDLTPEVKAKVMGLNAAKVFDVNPEILRCGFNESALSKAKRDTDEEFGAYRWAFVEPPMQTRRQFMMHDRWCRFLKTPG
ncbi:MAG: amidohydrolase family protein [Myxococcales bacterium]|nr:amidohydrolase family protein [Myxococcales bacterium]